MIPEDQPQPEAQDETEVPPGVEQADLSANGDIAADLKCAQCGYNLRGLTLDQRCPECFTPIARSIHGNLLRYADADWVDRLRFGTSLMLWHIRFVVVTIIIGLVLMFVGGPRPLLQASIWLVPSGMKLWAIFVLTTPEPAVEFDEDPLTLRRAIRFCAIIVVAGWLGGNLAGAATSPLALQAISGTLGLIGLIADVGIFIYLRRFAIRLPNERLARQTWTVMWGYVVAMSVVTIGGAIYGIYTRGATATGAGPPTGAMAISGVFMCPATLGVAVFFIWWVVLLFDYKNSFAANAEAARSIADGQVPNLDGNAAEGDTVSHDPP